MPKGWDWGGTGGAQGFNFVSKMVMRYIKMIKMMSRTDYKVRKMAKIRNQYN